MTGEPVIFSPLHSIQGNNENNRALYWLSACFRWLEMSQESHKLPVIILISCSQTSFLLACYLFRFLIANYCLILIIDVGFLFIFFHHIAYFCKNLFLSSLKVNAINSRPKKTLTNHIRMRACLLHSLELKYYAALVAGWGHSDTWEYWRVWSEATALQ